MSTVNGFLKIPGLVGKKSTGWEVFDDEYSNVHNLME
jgi:hypothetical protein